MAGLTKLRAVNIALENIGETPVNTLVGSDTDVFVSVAIDTLEEATRDVCGEVWGFNTDKEYIMSPDGAGNIIISDDMLSVDGTYKTDYFTVRAGKLYDKENQTFIFTDAVKVDIVWDIPYDDLPQFVRKYVAILAARLFARRQIGDTAGEQLTIQDEARARVYAKRHDAKNRDRTMFENYTDRFYRLKSRRIR